MPSTASPNAITPDSLARGARLSAVARYFPLAPLSSPLSLARGPKTVPPCISHCCAGPLCQGLPLPSPCKSGELGVAQFAESVGVVRKLISGGHRKGVAGSLPSPYLVNAHTMSHHYREQREKEEEKRSHDHLSV
jgi:hypothetical protein